MKFLLDVNLLIARLVRDHTHKTKAAAWISGKDIVLCPIVELGFLRISTLPQFGYSMVGARQALESFALHMKVERIPDDLPALESHPKNSAQVTDHYLADLAAKHGLKLATLDQNIKHVSVELIS